MLHQYKNINLGSLLFLILTRVKNFDLLLISLLGIGSEQAFHGGGGGGGQRYTFGYLRNFV